MTITSPSLRLRRRKISITTNLAKSKYSLKNLFLSLYRSLCYQFESLTNGSIDAKYRERSIDAIIFLRVCSTIHKVCNIQARATIIILIHRFSGGNRSQRSTTRYLEHLLSTRVDEDRCTLAFVVYYYFICRSHRLFVFEFQRTQTRLVSSWLRQRERPSIIDGNAFLRLKVPAREPGPFADAIERTSHDRRKEGIRMEFRTNQLKIDEIHDSNFDRCLEFATYVGRIDRRQTSLREAFEASPSHVNLPLSAFVR